MSSPQAELTYAPRQQIDFASPPVLWSIALVVLTCLVFGRIVTNEFVAWDDPMWVSGNGNVAVVAGESYVNFWTKPFSGLYVPMTFSVWGIGGLLGHDITNRLHPWPFHLISLIVHCASVVLAFMVVRRVVKNDLAAVLGAALFAIHPLQVEPVAWISGLKDVLAGALALAAILLHITAGSSKPRHVWAAVAFLLAMLSKPSAASALLIAIVIDLLIEKKSLRETVLTLVPWFVIAVPLLILARIVQDTSHLPPVDLWKRPLVALDAMAFYMSRLFWPLRPYALGVDYGRNPARMFAGTAWHYSWIVPLVALAIIAASRKPVLIAGALIAIAGLIWNLGLVPFQFQLHSTVADHYAYLAMLGPALLLAWLACRWRTAFVPIAALLIVGFASVSFAQAGLWHDSVALFEHSLIVNDKSVAVHDNLGRVYAEKGDDEYLEKAADHFETSIDIYPENADAHRNLALLWLKFTNNRDSRNNAINYLKRSLELNEKHGVPEDEIRTDRKDLIKFMIGGRRFAEAKVELEKAIKLHPNDTELPALLQSVERRLNRNRPATTAASAPATQPDSEPGQ